jgi:hypothetical protein
MPYRRAVKVSDAVYERLMELTRRYNLESPNQLLEKLLTEGVTPLEAGGVTPSKTHGVTLSPDCVARRARKGDKPRGVYFLECKDGAKAVVPEETLADLTDKFKLKIEVID